MVKILGKHVEKGEFEGKSWAKIVLSVQLLELNKRHNDVDGIVVDVIRCPYNERFSRLKVGQEVTFLYDKYGKVAEYNERR